MMFPAMAVKVSGDDPRFVYARRKRGNSRLFIADYIKKSLNSVLTD
jgi:hypothetical protein